ncbi:triacylglycerol lipase [Ceratocystis lukuohia]|uniref:Triacylglycerol lipase n=1 Tax=Ceratocystis lukuohia TaxID=2019550 RepID=A0ABR4MJP7_9PEZI
MASDKMEKPRIALISLNSQSYFDDMYGSLLGQLRSKASLQQIKQADSAIKLLSEQPRLSAAIITDEALTETKNSHVYEAVLQYVRQGGTAVIMGHFSSYVRPLEMKPFFMKAGLPWEAGSYYRTTHFLNRDVVTGDLATKLPPQYSQKALFVKNVESAHALYQTSDDSVVESRVFAPRSAKVVGEAAVAFADIGCGKLGYLGDVNAEEESDAVILAMCGL